MQPQRSSFYANVVVNLAGGGEGGGGKGYWAAVLARQSPQALLVS